MVNDKEDLQFRLFLVSPSSTMPDAKVSGCIVCGKDNDDDKLLQCDGCESGFCHTYCAGLSGLPEEELLCGRLPPLLRVHSRTFTKHCLSRSVCFGPQRFVHIVQVAWNGKQGSEAVFGSSKEVHTKEEEKWLVFCGNGNSDTQHAAKFYCCRALTCG